MGRILILYATTHGHTRAVAQAIADRLVKHGARVRMVDIDSDHQPPDITAFEVVVLGSRVQFGSLARQLRKFVSQHLATLATQPVFVFSVGMAASDAYTSGPDPVLVRWCKEVRLEPRAAAAFAGALMYRSYSPAMKLLMRISNGRGGHKDTSRDYVFTDWTAVAKFADDIAGALPESPTTSVPSRVSRTPSRPRTQSWRGVANAAVKSTVTVPLDATVIRS